MIAPPPTSSLFPYTTLFRSTSSAAGIHAPASVRCSERHSGTFDPGRGVSSNKTPRYPARPPAGRRSEEHTSELQSRPHLVCRLLLEKKTMIKYTVSIDA